LAESLHTGPCPIKHNRGKSTNADLGTHRRGLIWQDFSRFFAAEPGRVDNTAKPETPQPGPPLFAPQRWLRMGMWLWQNRESGILWHFRKTRIT